MPPSSSPDYRLAVTTFALAIFGLVMISSVSVYQSYNSFGTNDFYFWRTFWHLVLALPIWFIVSQIPYRFFQKIAPLFFFLTILLLIAVFLPNLGANYGTSQSWLSVNFLPSIQPAEIAKLALILYMAAWIEKHHAKITTLEDGFLPFCVIMGIIVILLGLQPDFGSILAAGITATAIFFVAGGRITHILSGATLAVMLLIPIVMSKTYLKNRFLAFIDPTADPLNIGYQIKQALIAVGKGGWFGVGFGKSVQKFGYLPEVQGDTIFSAIAEEFGFLRIILLIAAFSYIAYRGLSIAKKTPDIFGKLTAVGITVSLVGQAFINIAVNLSLLPITGITLPFISYGGSSLIISFIAVGILINISRNGNILYDPINANNSNRRRNRRPHRSPARYY